jgi:hypothetical protein
MWRLGYWRQRYDATRRQRLHHHHHHHHHQQQQQQQQQQLLLLQQLLFPYSIATHPPLIASQSYQTLLWTLLKTPKYISIQLLDFLIHFSSASSTPY